VFFTTCVHSIASGLLDTVTIRCFVSCRLVSSFHEVKINPKDYQLLRMETVYGSHDEVHLFSGGTVSERVQNLASSVYREFEVMMNKYGDSVISNLMPQVVTILESLNQAYREKQEHEVELELLHVENDNLKVQFEREKQLRQSNEQVYLKRLIL